MNKKLKTSIAFKNALKNFQDQTGIPFYLIATRAKTHPSTLSYILNDTRLFLPNDEAIKRIAKVVGFKGECFELVYNDQQLGSVGS